MNNEKLKMGDYISELYGTGTLLISIGVWTTTGSFPAFMITIGAFVLIYALIIAMWKYA